MLFIGMGTEVVVFFLSAFDRPFDKSADGKELPADYETDEEIAASLGLVDNGDEENETEEQEELPEEAAPILSDVPAQPVNVPSVGGGTVIITGSTSSASVPSQPVAVETPDPVAAAQAAIQAATPEGTQPFENEAQRLAAIIRAANDELLRRAQAVLSPEMEEATQTYIAKLQTLAETFTKVDEQSARLAKDSEEMENLNRTLTGINKVYELHLKSISLQVGTIDQINGETQKLAQQIEELNRVYGRMIEALTVNMRGSDAARQNS